MNSQRLRRIRLELLQQSPWCSYCGDPLRVRTSCLDHIFPRCFGGNSCRGNLALSCKQCNRLKDCDPIDVFLARRVVRGGFVRFVFEVQSCERNDAMMKVAFDYSSLLESQRTLAKQSAGKIRDLIRLTATSIVEIGRLLADVHGVLRDEHYQAWLRAEFSWSHAVASHYEHAAKRFGEIDDKVLSHFQPGAIRILSNNNIKPEVVKEAIKRATKGQEISKVEAVKLIRKHVAPGEQAPAVLRAPLHQLRSAIRMLLALPLEERRQLADELVALAAQLRDGAMPTARVLTAATRAELPPAPRRRRIRELATA